MSGRSLKTVALKEFTDSLRGRGGLEHATAKFPMGGHDYEWRDYVRGKDLARHLRSQQELLDAHTRPAGAGRTQEDQVADFIVRLSEARLLLAADRRFKKPKPGRKKLVKWPRTLEPVADAGEYSEDLFYVFTYDKPFGPLLYIGAAAVVAGVLGCTLFPLAPYWARLAVVYAASGLLTVLLSVLGARYALWGAVWLLSGGHFWLLPSLLDDSVPVLQLLSPLVSWQARQPGDRASSLAARGAVAALLGCGCWALAVLGPDASTVQTTVSGARDSVLTYFDLIDSMKAGIANGTNTTGITLNTTSGSASGGAGGSEAGSAAAAGDEGDEDEAGGSKRSGSKRGGSKRGGSKRSASEGEGEGSEEL